jgi:hypothetical protein
MKNLLKIIIRHTERKRKIPPAHPRSQYWRS